MSAIRYQIVTELPVETVVELYQAGGWWRESARGREIIPQMIRGSLSFVVARSDDDRVVGMGRAISDGVSDAYIQDVVVRPEFRGQGIGGGVIRTLVEQCQQRGIEWLGLVAEPGTTEFYRELGFEPLSGYVAMRHAR